MVATRNVSAKAARRYIIVLVWRDQPNAYVLEKILSEPDTRTQILDTAMELVQLRGYNGFSFNDIADRVGITTASIHYHFKTKSDLGVAVVRRHRQVLADAFGKIDADVHNPWERLRLYASVFRSTLDDGGRMCLGGTLAIEYQTLSAELVAEVRGFFEDNEKWLKHTLKAGQKAGVVKKGRPAAEMARTLFAALEGAMLSGRAFGDFDRFDSAAAWILAQLKP
jgi:TetR/AcrR family transcriptional regulator, transcriptional repressor for nem operon